jgi:hypothetical protein
LDYPDFVAFVRRAAEDIGQNGLMKVGDLRQLAGAAAPRDRFDRHLLALRDDGYVHLLTHVQAEALPPQELADCLRQGNVLIYWVRWVAPPSLSPVGSDQAPAPTT